MKFHLAHIAATFAIMFPSAVMAGGSKSAMTARNGDWQWSLSGGPSWHYMGRLTIDGGSRSQSLMLPSFVGSSSLTVPPIGDAAANDERFYNDGYVRQDAGTVNDGTTWFWGYDNASQVSNGNLVYQATGFESIRNDSINTAAGRRSSDSMTAPGISLRADVTTPWTVGPFKVSGMIGLNVTSDSQSYHYGNHSTFQTRDDYRLDHADTYGLDGVIPPAAPYAGGIGGPGPLINNIPTTRSMTPVLVFTDTAVFANNVRAEFENDMVGLSAGASLDYHEAPWTFILSGGLVLEFHHYTASQNESLNVSTASSSAQFASWSDRNSGVKFRPGLFIEAAARYAIDGGCFIDGFVRGEIADDFRVSAGPTRFEFEPIGFSIGARIGRVF
jgi:hypothetical protein